LSDRLLPNWIQAYMAYTAQSRAPDEYHLWTALSAIAGAIRRKAFFNMDYFLLYPNLYVVLVGPPGRCKKSTAMRIGRGMLAQVPGVYFSTDSITRERLIQDLTQSLADGHSSMTAYSSEFASLLTSSGMDMVVFLTDIYDSPDEWSHKTKMGGTNKIKSPYLNMEGATTPDWIARSLPLDTVGIGLTARIIFVYQDTPRIREAFPELTKEQIELREVLIKDLTKISLISGQYVLDHDGKEFYKAWDLQDQKRETTHDPRLSGYFERKGMHLLKVAMLVAASKRDEPILMKEDLEGALELLGHIEPAMLKTFASVGKNPLTLDIAQIGATIMAKPGIDYADLLKLFKHSVRKEELDEVLNTLNLMNYAKAVQDTKGVRYYPTDTMKDDFKQEQGT
jgi:uncharacterized protein DUF3987